MSVVAVAIGVFYVFAGFVVMRATSLDTLMDKVLAALENKSDANEERRTKVLRVGAFLTLASGAALSLLSPLAPTLFIANTLVQGGYLLWAERALVPEGADERKGRRQTKNAFVIYLAATAFVVWLHLQGVLRPWSAPIEAHALDAGIIALSLVAAWAWIHLPRKSSSSENPLEGFAAAGDLPSQQSSSLPRRLRLAPEWNCSPLWDADSGEPVSVFRLGLPEDLADRIEQWDDLWQATYNHDDPSSGGFKTDKARQAYYAEGRAIAQELKRVWSGELEIAEVLR